MEKHPVEWLDEEVATVKANCKTTFPPDSPAWEGYLASTLEQIATARSIFMNDGRELLTLMLIIFVGAGIVAFQALLVDGIAESISLSVGALALIIFVWPVITAIQHKSHAAYEFYVASAIHAAIVHEV